MSTTSTATQGICNSATRLDGGFMNIYAAQSNNGILSTCFCDVVLLPVFTLALIPALLIVFFNYKLHSTRAGGMNTSDSYQSFDTPSNTKRTKNAAIPLNPYTTHQQTINLDTPSNNPVRKFGNKFGRLGGGRKSLGSPSKRAKLLLGLTIFFLIAQIAMNALEIARLVSSKRGVGFLPACFFGLLVALASLFMRPHTFSLTVTLSVYFLAMCVVTGVKINSLARVRTLWSGSLPTTSYNSYGFGDQELDNGVMCGVYFVLGALEIIMSAFDNSRAV